MDTSPSLRICYARVTTACWPRSFDSIVRRRFWLQDPSTVEVTLGGMLRAGNFSQHFIEHYLLPDGRRRVVDAATFDGHVSRSDATSLLSESRIACHTQSSPVVARLREVATLTSRSSRHPIASGSILVRISTRCAAGMLALRSACRVVGRSLSTKWSLPATAMRCFPCWNNPTEQERDSDLAVFATPPIAPACTTDSRMLPQRKRARPGTICSAKRAM